MHVGVMASILLFLTAAQAADYYQGRQIRLIVSTPAGSAYDTYARLIQKFMPEHIPGRPAIVVQNMEGSSGLQAANYLANGAPRDGTVIGAVEANIPTAPLFFPGNAKFDSTQMNWIGSITSDPFIGFTFNSRLRTYEQARQETFIMGAPSARSYSAQMPQVSNALFGTKFKLIVGYAGSEAVKLAMERGELDGTFGNAWSDLKAQRPGWIAERKVNILTQFALKRHPDLPDVPLFIDQAKTLEDKELLTMLAAPQEWAKPYVAPPGTQQEPLTILRAAFSATVMDRRFVDATHTAGLDVYAPLDGEALARLVTQLANTPPAFVKRARDMLAM
jgi:tripartite-type tricarboxylate transporter receptor subunit TctC